MKNYHVDRSTDGGGQGVDSSFTQGDLGDCAWCWKLAAHLTVPSGLSSGIS